jgi:hypothetical protein
MKASMASPAMPRKARRATKRRPGQRIVEGAKFRLAEEVRYITRRAAHSSPSVSSRPSRLHRSASVRPLSSQIEAAVPVKLRQAKERRHSFSAEAIALFIELEAVPVRRRKLEEFRDRERELAGLLGLGAEFFLSCCSVLDRERTPCWPPWCAAHADWHRVRAVREQLLEAAATQGLNETALAVALARGVVVIQKS